MITLLTFSKDYGVLDHRLGFIVDFLSHATIVGFMAGAATVVCLQQLKAILGLEHFTHGTDLVSVMRSVFSQTHEVRSFLTIKPVADTYIRWLEFSLN